MKKSEFRKLVQETIAAVLSEQAGILTEKFESVSAGKLYGRLKGNDAKFFQGMAKTSNIDWAHAPEEAFGKGPDSSKINFFFVNKAKDNVYNNGGWDYSVSPGLIGVTRGKEKLHVVSARWTANKQKDKPGVSGEKSIRRKSDKDAMGQGLEGIHNYKRFVELSDEVITIDLKKIPTTDDLKASRKEAQRGAAALVSAREVANANNARYKKALTIKVAATGAEGMDKLMADASKVVQQVIDKNTQMLKQGKYQTSWDTYKTVTDRYSRMVDSYVRYKQEFAAEEKDKKKNPSTDDGDNWRRDYVANYMKEVKDYYRELLQMAKKVNDGEYRDIVNK